VSHEPKKLPGVEKIARAKRRRNQAFHDRIRRLRAGEEIYVNLWVYGQLRRCHVRPYSGRESWGVHTLAHRKNKKRFFLAYHYIKDGVVIDMATERRCLVHQVEFVGELVDAWPKIEW